MIACPRSVINALPNVPFIIVAAAWVAKIIATPIPEFEQGGLFGAARPRFAHGRLNAKARVTDVGHRHSGCGIRMVDGATGEHLGEWERGEAYLIRATPTPTTSSCSMN